MPSRYNAPSLLGLRRRVYVNNSNPRRYRLDLTHSGCPTMVTVRPPHSPLAHNCRASNSNVCCPPWRWGSGDRSSTRRLHRLVSHQDLLQYGRVGHGRVLRTSHHGVLRRAGAVGDDETLGSVSRRAPSPNTRGCEAPFSRFRLLSCEKVRRGIGSEIHVPAAKKGAIGFTASTVYQPAILRSGGGGAGRAADGTHEREPETS